ncbi:hypothetical protein JOD24_002519 [Kroppenstedtia sanguinis]
MYTGITRNALILLYGTKAPWNTTPCWLHKEDTIPVHQLSASSTPGLVPLFQKFFGMRVSVK